jgi:hypothetical protein
VFTVKNNRQIFPCPICAYGLPYPAADFNICPSCGVEFGYETAGRSFADLRKEWVASGAHWASPVVPEPVSWNPWLQLIQGGFSYAIRFPVQVKTASQPEGDLLIPTTRKLVLV